MPAKRGGGRAAGPKPEVVGQPMRGRIVRLLLGQGYGFIRASDGREVYFHKTAAQDGTFNRLETDDLVTFDLVEDRLTGPRAVRVRKEAS